MGELMWVTHMKTTDELRREAQELARAEGTTSPVLWALPWPCLHEFYAITTRPRIYDPPGTADEAIGQVASWLELPSVGTAERRQHLLVSAELTARHRQGH